MKSGGGLEDEGGRGKLGRRRKEKGGDFETRNKAKSDTRYLACERKLCEHLGFCHFMGVTSMHDPGRCGRMSPIIDDDDDNDDDNDHDELQGLRGSFFGT